MAKYTFSNLAQEALKKASFPMTPNELWDFIMVSELDKKLEGYGKTPQASLAANLYVDSKKTNSLFYISSKKPTKFWLKSRANELDSKEVKKSIQT